MKCPNCDHHAPESSKFCNQCGNKLLLICSECEKENPPGSKFCAECGSAFQTSGPDLSPLEEKIDKIQRYLPQGLTDKILAQKDRIEGERKIVTVLFCDLVGYTAMANKLDPEDTFNLMDQVSEILIHKVHDYGGTVNQWTGDGLYALFGAPIALEDGPQRAIRSAMDMHKELTKFSEKITKEQDISPLRMRIGINTGPVVMGTIGNSLRVDFTAIGDTVNLASRIEGIAEPGTVYVTNETFKQAEHYFRFEALGRKKVKGIDTPIHVYQVIAPSNRSTRFDVSAERGLTPLVGRDREIDLLLEGYGMAKSGRGQVFAIVAEAGTGKSRLLYEFRKRLTNEDITVLEGKCLSYSKSMAYQPILDIVKSHFGIERDDRETDIRKKLQAGIENLHLETSKILPFMFELFSFKETGVDSSIKAPGLAKERISEYLGQIVIRASEPKPIVLIVEDLHWIDKNSEFLLEDLINSIAGSAVLLILTYRPEYEEHWGRKSHYNQLNLNRLINRESVDMVRNLLGIRDVDPKLQELVIEKAEGIPFFIEELIKGLIDMSLLIEQEGTYLVSAEFENLDLPATIQNIILARVDQLPEQAREILQIGSVIGREFNYELIREVVELSDGDISSTLSTIKESELLYERGIRPNAVYIFKHSLTRDVIYDSILSSQKKTMHEKIGKAVEKLYQEVIGDYVAILAEHYSASGNLEKGIAYSTAAARKAQKHSDFNSAIYFANKRTFSVEKLTQTEAQQDKLIEARILLGRYYMQMNYHHEAKEAINPIIDLVKKHGEKGDLAQIYTIIGTYYSMIEDNIPKAIEYLEKAVQLAEEVDDFVSISATNLFLGATYYFPCEFKKSMQALEKSLDISLVANNIWGVSQLKGFISYYVYNPTGQLGRAFQTSEEAVHLADESGDTHSKAMACICHGRSNLYKGYLEQAVEFLEKGAELCEGINHIAWNVAAQAELCETYTELGDYEKAIFHVEKAVKLAIAGGLSAFWVDSCRLWNNIVKILNQSLDFDLSALNKLYQGISVNVLKALIQPYIAKVLIKTEPPQYDDAEVWIKRSIATNEKYGTKTFSWKPYVVYSEFFQRRNNLPQASEQMTKAIDIMKECGADGWVDRYEKELRVGFKTTSHSV